MSRLAFAVGVLAACTGVQALHAPLSQDPDYLADNVRDALLHHEFPLLGSLAAIAPNPEGIQQGYGLAGAAGFKFAPTEFLGFEPQLDDRERGYCWDRLYSTDGTFNFLVADGAMFDFNIGLGTNTNPGCSDKLGPNSVIATYCSRVRTRTWNPTTCPIENDPYRGGILENPFADVAPVDPANEGPQRDCFPRFSATGFQWDDPTAILWNDRYYVDANASGVPTAYYSPYAPGDPLTLNFTAATNSYVANLETPGHPWCPARHTLWVNSNNLNGTDPIEALVEQGHINVDFSRAANPPRLGVDREQDLTQSYATIADPSSPSGTWNYVLSERRSPVAYHTGYASGVELELVEGTHSIITFDPLPVGLPTGNAFDLVPFFGSVTADDFKLLGDGFNVNGTASMIFSSLPADDFRIVVYALTAADFSVPVADNTIVANGRNLVASQFGVYEATNVTVTASGDLVVRLPDGVRVLGVQLFNLFYTGMELRSEGVFHYKCPSGALTDPVNRERLRRAIVLAQNASATQFIGWEDIWDRALMINMTMYVEIDDANWGVADNAYVIVRQTIRMELPVERHHWDTEDAFGFFISDIDALGDDIGGPEWGDDGERLGQIIISHMDMDLGTESSLNFATFEGARQANHLWDQGVCGFSVSQAVSQCDEYGELLYDVGDYRELNHPWLGERIDWVTGNEIDGYERGEDAGLDGRFLGRPEMWMELYENFTAEGFNASNWNNTYHPFPLTSGWNDTWHKYHSGEGAQLLPNGLIDRRFIGRLALDGRDGSENGTPLQGDVATNMAVFFGARDYSSSSVPDHFEGDHNGPNFWPNGVFTDAYYHQDGANGGSHFHLPLVDQRSRTVTFEYLFKRGAGAQPTPLGQTVDWIGRCPNVGHRFYNRFPWTDDDLSDGGKFLNRYANNPDAADGIGLPWELIEIQPMVRPGAYTERFDVDAAIDIIDHQGAGEFLGTLPSVSFGTAAGQNIWLAYKTCTPNTQVAVVFDIDGTRYDRLFVYECCVSVDPAAPYTCLEYAPACRVTMSRATGTLTTPAPFVTRQAAFVHPYNGTTHRREGIPDFGRQQRNPFATDPNRDADAPYYPAWYYDEADATFALSPTFDSWDGTERPIIIATPAADTSVAMQLGVDSLFDPVAHNYIVRVTAIAGAIVPDDGSVACPATVAPGVTPAPGMPGPSCGFPPCVDDPVALAAIEAECATVEGLGQCNASLVVDDVVLENVILKRGTCTKFKTQNVSMFWDCVQGLVTVQYDTPIFFGTSAYMQIACSSGSPVALPKCDFITPGLLLDALAPVRLPASAAMDGGVLDAMSFRTWIFEIGPIVVRKRAGIFGNGTGAVDAELSFFSGSASYNFTDACGAADTTVDECSTAEEGSAAAAFSNFGDFAISWAQVANRTIRYTMRYLDRPLAEPCPPALEDDVDFLSGGGDTCASFTDAEMVAYCTNVDCNVNARDEALFLAVRVELNDRQIEDTLRGVRHPVYRTVLVRLDDLYNATDVFFDPADFSVIGQMDSWRISDIAYDAVTDTQVGVSLRKPHPAFAHSVFSFDRSTAATINPSFATFNTARRYGALAYAKGVLYASWQEYTTLTANTSLNGQTFFGPIDPVTGDSIGDVILNTTVSCTMPSPAARVVGMTYIDEEDRMIAVFHCEGFEENGTDVDQAIWASAMNWTQYFADPSVGGVVSACTDAFSGFGLAGAVQSLTSDQYGRLYVGTSDGSVLYSSTVIMSDLCAVVMPMATAFTELYDRTDLAALLSSTYVNFNRSTVLQGLMMVHGEVCITNRDLALSMGACDRVEVNVCPQDACERRCARVLGECEDRLAGDGDGFIIDFGGDRNVSDYNDSNIYLLRDAYTGQDPLPPGHTPAPPPHDKTTQERPQSARRLAGTFGPSIGLTIPQDLELVSSGIDRDGKQYYVYEGIFDAHYNVSGDVTVSWSLLEKGGLDPGQLDNLGWVDNFTNYRALAARNIRCGDVARGEILSVPVLDEFVPADVHNDTTHVFRTPAMHMGSVVPLPLIYQLRSNYVIDLDTHAIPASLNGTRMDYTECRFGYEEAGLDDGADRLPLAPNNKLMSFADDDGGQCNISWDLSNIILPPPLCPNGAKYQTPLYGEGGQSITLHDLTVEIVDNATAPMLSSEVIVPGPDAVENHFLVLEGEEVRAGELFALQLFTAGPGGVATGEEAVVTIHSRLGSLAPGQSSVIGLGETINLFVRTKERAHGSTVQIVWAQITSLVTAESSWVAIVLKVRDALDHNRIWHEMDKQGRLTREAIWDHFEALGVQLDAAKGGAAAKGIQREFQDLAEYIQSRKDDVLNTIGAQGEETRMAIWDHFEQLGVQLEAQINPTIDTIVDGHRALIDRVHDEGEATRQYIWLRLAQLANGTQGLQLGAELSVNATLLMLEAAETATQNALMSTALQTEVDAVGQGAQATLDGLMIEDEVDGMREHLEEQLEELREQLRSRDIAIKQALDRIKSVVTINGINIARTGQDVRKLTHESSGHATSTSSSSSSSSSSS